VAVHAAVQDPQERPPEQQHDRDVERAAADGEDRDEGRALDVGEHQREQAPGRGIVARAGRKRERAHAGARDALLVQDAREHRERGDGHRGAQVQRGRARGHVGREQIGVAPQHERGAGAERQRHHDPRARDERGVTDAAQDQPMVELHADDEHVEHEADLAQRIAPTRRPSQPQTRQAARITASCRKSFTVRSCGLIGAIRARRYDRARTAGGARRAPSPRECAGSRPRSAS